MGLQKRSTEEIDNVVNDAWDSINEGSSRYPGMSYEEGVRAALDWVTGETDENPFEEN